MSKLYTIISCSEDGDHDISVITKEELDERLEKDDYGPRACVCDKIGDAVDLNTINGIFIIPGEPIKPKSVKTVTKWEV